MKSVNAVSKKRELSQGGIRWCPPLYSIECSSSIFHCFLSVVTRSVEGMLCTLQEGFISLVA